MKLQKRSILTLGVFAALALSVVSFTSGAKNHSSFSLKEAQASTTIECDCALFGGNNNCLANNYGSSCAPDGTSNCQSYNSNCGGTNPPTTTAN